MKQDLLLEIAIGLYDKFNAWNRDSKPLTTLEVVIDDITYIGVGTAYEIRLDLEELQGFKDIFGDPIRTFSNEELLTIENHYQELFKD
jgi:hypothetical protein